MAGELAIKIGAAVTKATGYMIDWADATFKRKSTDENGVVSTLSNDGLHDLNILTNGGFTIQQRVAVASTAIPSISTSTRAGQVADRWAVTTGNTTTCLWQQVDTGAANEANLNHKHYGKITQNTNAAKFILSQFLANEDIHHLRGKKVRCSVKIKQFAGSNAGYRLGLLQLTAAGTIDVCPAFTTALGGASVDPTWGTNLAAIAPDSDVTPENGTIDGNGIDITSTAAWVRSSAVFTIPTDAKNLCFVFYRDTIGAASDACGIAEFQMTEGPDLVEWVPIPRAIEMQRCQRYFCKTFTYATVPVTNAGVTTGCVKWSAGVAGAVSGTWSTHAFPVPMFKVPTVTIFNPAAANAQVRQIGATAGDCSSSVAAEITDHSTAFTATPGASAVVGTILGCHYTAEAEFLT